MEQLVARSTVPQHQLKPLVQALPGGGGSPAPGAGVGGVLVHGHVRLLNAAFDHEKAALDRIPADTSAAITGGDRPTMIALGARYDTLNNGVCKAS